MRALGPRRSRTRHARSAGRMNERAHGGSLALPFPSPDSLLPREERELSARGEVSFRGVVEVGADSGVGEETLCTEFCRDFAHASDVFVAVEGFVGGQEI